MKLHPSMIKNLIMYKVDYATINLKLHDTVTIWYRSVWGFKKEQVFTFRCFGVDNNMGEDCKELVQQLKNRFNEIEREYYERTENG